MTHTIRVLAFAGARDAIGRDAFDLALDAPTSARALLDRICKEHDRLAPYASSLRLAINGAYAAWDDLVHDGDEVAIIPPVAGG
jgi:molybdopterin converting factor small subunit